MEVHPAPSDVVAHPEVQPGRGALRPVLEFQAGPEALALLVAEPRC